MESQDHDKLLIISTNVEEILGLLKGERGLITRVDVLEGLADRGKGVLWLAGGGGILGAASALIHWFRK